MTPCERSLLAVITSRLYERFADTVATDEESRGRHASCVVIKANEATIAALMTVGVVERTLDHYVVGWCDDEADGEAVARRALFGNIANDYDAIVQPTRNRDNYVWLCELAGADVPGTRLLDFGAGTGLNFRPTDPWHYVACDASPEMRARAAPRVPRVVSPHELPGMNGTFDVAVASYVLHLGLGRADIGIVLEAISVGGRLAANFHKGRRLEEVSELVEDDGRFERLRVTEADPMHGPAALWCRRV